MLKKLLFSIFFFVLIVGAFKAYALLGKEGQRPSEWQNNVTYSNLYVVSENDFNDEISIRATSTPNINLFIEGDFSDDSTLFKPISPISNITTDNNGLAFATATYKWPANTLAQSYPQEITYTASFKATDKNTGAVSNPVGVYSAVVRYAEITLTNNKSMTNGQYLASGNAVTFQCTNATTMTISPAPASPSTWSWANSGYTHTGTFTNKDATSKQYTIICRNIGGDSNQKTFTFNTDPTPASCPQGEVKDSTGYCHPPCPTGQTWDEVSKTCKSNNQPTFDITNINSSPNQSGATSTFTWVSEADTCNVYDNSKATRLNPTNSTKSGNNFSATVFQKILYKIPTFNLG